MAIGPDIEDEHAPVLTVTEARQGMRGRHIAWVLGISLTLVIIALGLVWLAHAPSLSSADQKEANARSADVAREFRTPSTQPSASSSPASPR